MVATLGTGPTETDVAQKKAILLPLFSLPKQYYAKRARLDQLPFARENLGEHKNMEHRETHYYVASYDENQRQKPEKKIVLVFLRNQYTQFLL
jgi:hypothetical protein